MTIRVYTKAFKIGKWLRKKKAAAVAFTVAALLTLFY